MKRFLVLFSFLSLLFIPFVVNADSLIERVKGYILLQVEQNGEAWFVRPVNGKRYYMKNGEVAYEMMRSFGLGITDADLGKIQSVTDTTTMNASNATCKVGTVANQVRGRILLQVQQNGEAWYVHPQKCLRIYMKDGDAAFTIMRFLGLGITDTDLQAIPTANGFTLPNGTPTTPDDPPGTLLDDQHDSQRSALLGRINLERSNMGLGQLSLSFSLSTAAQSQADDMTTRNYFAFASPEGKTFDEWVQETGYVPHTLAENLAQTNQGITGLVSVWESQSPISYNNVINSEYKELGVGVGTFQGVPIYTVIFARSLEDYFNQQTSLLDDIEQVRVQLLERVNLERAQQGLSVLEINTLLNQAAQGHTDDMLARAYYAHESPEGTTPHERITATGYSAQLSAENIAKGQFSVEQVMDDWMNSPSHRANILEPDFEEIGFGLSFGANNNGLEIIWAQEFGKPL